MVLADKGYKNRAGWLFRRWKAAAGPLASQFMSAAPFTALSLYGEALLPESPAVEIASLDRICQKIAGLLIDTEQAEQVRSAEAAFVLDLPGALSAGLGYHLQKAGLTPVLAWSGLHRPGSLLEGRAALAALDHYGPLLQKGQSPGGWVFLLERERTGPLDLDDLSLINTFDNRYHASELLFPPLTELKASGLTALIDLRLESDRLPEDLDRFYREAAKAELNVYQVFLPAAWLIEES